MIDDLLSEIQKIQDSTSLKSINLSENERFIFNKANNLLSRREYSKIELTKKLRQRIPNEEGLISEVIKKLEDANYLSEDRYSEMIIKKLLKRGIAEQNIINELGTHHIIVTKEKIRNIAEELGLNKQEQVLLLAKKKLRLIKSKPLQKQRESLIRFLSSKGYKYEDIKSCIAEIFTENC